MLRHLVPLGVDDLGARPGEEAARGPEENIVLLGAGDARSRLRHAVALPNVPVRVDFEHLRHCLLAEGRGAGVEEADRGEVVLLGELLVPEEGDDDGGHL